MEDQEEYDEVYDDNDGYWGQEGGIEWDRVQLVFRQRLNIKLNSVGLLRFIYIFKGINFCGFDIFYNVRDKCFY